MPRYNHRYETLSFPVNVLRETDKAWQVQFYSISRRGMASEWVPKSQVEMHRGSGDDDFSWTLELPRWLAEEKGLEDA